MVEEGEKTSKLEQLRLGPTLKSTAEIVRFLTRLETIRVLDIRIPVANAPPKGRILALARFATTAKVTAISRFTEQRRLATLVAFINTIEAKGQDDVLELFEVIIRNIFSRSTKLYKKSRMRTLRDLDKAAGQLHKVCMVLLDETLSGDQIREEAFKKVPQSELESVLKVIANLTENSEGVYTPEMQDEYRRVRRFLPHLLKAIKFEGNPAGQPLLRAIEHIKTQDTSKPFLPLPSCIQIVSKKWEKHVLKNNQLDTKAYTFCVLEKFQNALKKRDVFVTPSILYTDPRIGLLEGEEWTAACPLICSSLGLTTLPQPIINKLATRLDDTYKKVVANLPNNPFLRIENVKDANDELVLTHLDELQEPDSLKALRQEINARIPKVDLPDLLLEISTHTGFADLFTHISEKGSRIEDFTTSICAALLSEACNLGIEPLVRNDIPALRRSRLVWILQNYFRHETLINANNCLVAAQNKIWLAHAWGGGYVASADGLRFVVPVRSLQAGPNPKYYAQGNGITYYNLVSDQFTGIGAATVTGTLRDSLVLLGVVLGQLTELNPVEIMTDTGAYSDTIFALFYLLGYQFSPRIADTGGSRLWRIDAAADYGVLNNLSRYRVNTRLIERDWEDILRLVGSLKLGTVQANSVMRMLQVGDSPSKLSLALREFGKIIKTIHILEFIDDEEKRRRTLTQLNRGEGRHSLARAVFHAKRGELRERYREGQEDKLGALGLVVNIIILWNTIYMDAAITQLKAEGYDVKMEDVKRLSPLSFGHINLMGRYTFVTLDCIKRWILRPLRNPLNSEED